MADEEDNILWLSDKVRTDNSIARKQYHAYTPYTQAYDNNDEIRIAIQFQDLYVIPSESFIYIDVDVTVPAPVAGVEPPTPRFSKCFASFLFSEIRYELNGVEIDRCKNPGITAQLKRLAASRLDNTMHLIKCYENEEITSRSYQLIIPLTSILGFADDYRKVMLNAKHELILQRSRTNRHVYHANSANQDLVTFAVRRVHWKIPHVQLNDETKLLMLSFLKRQRLIAIPYRTWDLYEVPQLPTATKHIWTVKTTSALTKPRYVIVAFQTNRSENNRLDSSNFDHCNVRDVKLFLNNDYYPYGDFNADFNSSNFIEHFMTALQVQDSYYGHRERYNPFALNTLEAFNTQPIFAFDCSRSDESLLNSSVDVRIEIHARANIPDNTTAFCLIIHDNIISYSPYDAIVTKSV